MTRAGIRAKIFVKSVYPNAKFILRNDMDMFWRGAEPNQCQILDDRNSRSSQWSYNENDAWIDAQNYIHKLMLKKLES
jgi:hypothetical protein